MKKIEDITFVCFDTETTGLYPKLGCKICEIAISVSKCGKKIKTYSTLINPQIPISPDVIKVHGITDEMVKNKPTFKDIALDLQEYFTDCVFVGHNIPFDIKFIQEEFENVGLKLPEMPCLDTLKFARTHYHFPNNRLGTIVNELGFSNEGWHRAMNDTLMTEKVFYKFLADMQAKGAKNIQDLVSLQYNKEVKNNMKKVVLLIRDGWGERNNTAHNAIASAKTPNIDNYIKNYPHTLIEASGEQVGLPAGYMGSSEVGHLNMGAGRIVVQELKRLKDAFEDGSLYQTPALKAVIDNCIKNNSALHLMGLVQDEGVHAHQDHLYSLLKYAVSKGIKNIWVHFFADGRDTPPNSALGYLKMLEDKFKEYGAGKVATLMGRYYAMDRNETWQLTTQAYDLIIDAKGRVAKTALNAIEDSYKNDKTPDGSKMVDEYIPPTVIEGYKGVQDGDGIIFFNFRQDRAIQLTRSFVEEDFPLPRARRPKITFCGLTKYYDSFKFNALSPMSEGGSMNNLLGEVISKSN